MLFFALILFGCGLFFFPYKLATGVNQCLGGLLIHFAEIISTALDLNSARQNAYQLKIFGNAFVQYAYLLTHGLKLSGRSSSNGSAVKLGVSKPLNG